METKTKIFIVSIFNLAFVFGIGIAVNFNTHWWIVFTAFYLCGTLLGTFFGAYVMKQMIEIKRGDYRLIIVLKYAHN